MYQGVGTGNIFSLAPSPAGTVFDDEYTNRTERTTEWFAHDRIEWNAQLSTWVGLRHSQLQRSSVRTDGSRATDYAQSFTTPWLAVAWQWRPETMVYASTGQGIETAVAPGRAEYTNAGMPLDPIKSRQWELGLKHAWHRGDLSAAVFGITRPRTDELRVGSGAGSRTFQMDGDDQHRGLELTARQRLGAWTLDGSAMWLAAQRRNGQIDPSLNGKRPTNVPDFVLRAGATLAIAQVPGLTVHARASHEGRRAVVPDGSVQLPSWTRVDAGLAYRTRLSNQPATWRLGVSNLLNRRYFQESPYQYSHIYLFPAAPRTVSLGLDMSF
jgi:iron complex outermembrane receptor protein